MTPDAVESQLISAIEVIQRGRNGHIGSRSFAEFAEEAHGYPGIEQLFESAVQIASKLWGPPAKVAHGRPSGRADVVGVPGVFLNSRALRYAFWSTPNVLAALAMLTHDADTLRSFELTMKAGGR